MAEAVKQQLFAKFRFIALLFRCIVGGGALDAPHTMLRIRLNAP